MHNAQCTIFCNFADVKLYGCRVVYKKEIHTVSGCGVVSVY